MRKLIIFGAAEQAELAHYYFTFDSEYEVCAFTVDYKYLETDSYLGLPVCNFENIEKSFSPDEYSLFIAVGYSKINKSRATKYMEAKEKGYALASYISSKATLYDNVKHGENCFILEDNTIQPFVTIGNNVTLWSGNHIGHHSTIHDHCFITSQVVVSGGVTIENYCFIGVNSTIRDHITIGQETVIGAGSLIMKSTLPKSVFVPVPTAPANITSDKLRRL